MYLKEIQMENFKSFGRKTVVPFYTGYTCITGPNGSGKSNISDAILFVLGPKSSKAVRASKLTDLIFNGGPAKKPSKYTRVTLVFDNASRIIPVDTNEVELTRVVKISPTNPEGYYSYFYVNGKSSSLNEFDTLLAHARISAEGYNLVQQGDVTRIVNMGNIDRRRVLDGIAGITQYDEDINKAEIKRKEVEDNLEKIDTLLS
jgi:chromosome segregation protein